MRFQDHLGQLSESETEEIEKLLERHNNPISIEQIADGIRGSSPSIKTARARRPPSQFVGLAGQVLRRPKSNIQFTREESS